MVPRFGGLPDSGECVECAMRILEEALTFDDVLLVPAHSTVLPREVDLSTTLTRSIRLGLPVLSAAMDTVTEARLAITIAQEGGMGIIHKNMPIEAQAREVARVKKFESGVIRDPITVPPGMTIREVLQLTRARGISGVPVVDGDVLPIFELLLHVVCGMAGLEAEGVAAEVDGVGVRGGAVVGGSGSF